MSAEQKALMSLQAKTSKACKPIPLSMRQRLPFQWQHQCNVL